MQTRPWLVMVCSKKKKKIHVATARLSQKQTILSSSSTPDHQAYSSGPRKKTDRIRTSQALFLGDVRKKMIDKLCPAASATRSSHAAQITIYLSAVDHQDSNLPFGYVVQDLYRTRSNPGTSARSYRQLRLPPGNMSHLVGHTDQYYICPARSRS